LNDPALIALGANLGDPLQTLAQAISQLGAHGEVVARSRPYLTAPVGGPPGQPDYVNAVIAFRPAEAALGPADLLALLLDLERLHGRERRIAWDARTLDLDLLAWGHLRVATAGLTLPHPRLGERAFVLVPLADVMPQWRHPVSGAGLNELLAGVDTSGVRPLVGGWPDSAEAAW